MPTPAPEAPRLSLTRRYRFTAAHTYRLPELSDAENARRFGKGSGPHGHGHDYTLEVTLEGEAETRTGMLTDLQALDALVQREILDALDYKHLNHEVPAFQDRLPTCENLARFVWERLEGHCGPARLARVRVQESERLYAELRRA